jgi:hypothetical protein
MSYLSLLFSSATWGTANASGVNRDDDRDFFTEPDAGEGAWTGGENGPEDGLLPLGIASMEHWLDLNA